MHTQWGQSRFLTSLIYPLLFRGRAYKLREWKPALGGVVIASLIIQSGGRAVDDVLQSVTLRLNRMMVNAEYP